MKEPFSFSRKQRLGVWVLGVILLTEILYLSILPLLIKPKPLVWNNTDWHELLSSLEKDSIGYPKLQPQQLTPFNFDPNTLDESGFIRLGLSAKLARTILNYRAKGGHFYQKEGFKKMWGLHPDHYKQLEPFIQITTVSTLFQPKQCSIELNTCDTSQLIALSGIGSWMAQQIITYREKLGGFVRKEQVQEVYGFHSEIWPKIKDQLWVKKKPLHKINLNAATLQEINNHPYLHGSIALSLVNYRKEHDYHIATLEELRQVPLINEELFRKIAPYISLQ